MRKNQDGFSFIELAAALALLATLIGVVFFVFQKQHNPTLSDEDISKKFDCNRITMDARDTDVFCDNPKFYNDPPSVTKDDYFKYYACDERLKDKPPAESAIINDPGYYDAFYNCKDETKLESLRQDFVQELEQLKAKHS